MKKELSNNRILFVLTIIITFFLFYFQNSSGNNIVVHVKVISKVDNNPQKNIRVILLELNHPILAFKTEQHFKDIDYTNGQGLVSFIINDENEYVIWIENIKKNTFAYIDINQKLDNHTLIVEKI